MAADFNFKLSAEDFLFSEFDIEMMSLGLYVELLEQHIPRLITAEKERIWSNYDMHDDEQRQVGSYLESQLENGITTRFFSAAALMATWAIYEACVTAVASKLAEKQNVELRMSQLKRTFIKRARVYFEYVLRFPLHGDGCDWERLERIADIRHILAHANGHIQDVQEDLLNRVNKWARSDPGITITDGDEYVLVSFGFVRESLVVIRNLLHDLIHRARRRIRELRQ